MRVPVVVLFLLSGCTTPVVSKTVEQRMVVSFYKATTTASGERVTPYHRTAAHKKLPFNTCLMLQHDKKVSIIRINDRGPFIKGRDLDINYQVAIDLGILNKGVATVIATHTKCPSKLAVN